MPAQVGGQVAGYEILGLIGQGAMAVVYRAHHTRLNRTVALKMIHRGYLDDPQFLMRFEREAQIAAGLEHPNIVPVYDYADDDGQPYIVMKYIDGPTLKSLMGNGRPDLARLTELLPPIASALDYAHHAGVLHRDIKPSNILLDSHGQPYVSDFGLARLALSPESSLSEGMLIGTPAYMSPEQARGDLPLDYRADLYSLGVVLYELATGKTPFPMSSSLAALQQQVNAIPTPPTVADPALPQALDAVMQRALAKDPAERYASAGELVTAFLTAFGNPSRPTPSAAPVRVDAPAPANEVIRRRVWPWLAAGLVALIVMLLAVSLVLRRARELEQRTSATASATAVVTADVPPAEPSPTPELAGYAMINVPDETIEAAQASVDANPQNPLALLMLIRAQYAGGAVDAARQTITRLPTNTPDAARVYMTAGDLAQQAGDPVGAFAAFAEALALSEGAADQAVVREAAGARMAEVAQQPGALDAAGIRRVEAALGSTIHPIASALLAEALLTSGRGTLAQLRIRSLVREYPQLAEAQLVLGAVEYARGAQTLAAERFSLALAQPDAPAWVRERAQSLLETITS